ncbi:hypothetical protein CDCA_CDCA17G4459 [Cyanidium caldarium]|uniref:Uncharacterized protein n=1 Tax=Cyanidium caldarium TaxID=2771 RepID=A0AAV9J1L3_CYACA|nr:hypothetical protein CDCA_CDCA17G4459 [Cyanidium caldarium]
MFTPHHSIPSEEIRKVQAQLAPEQAAAELLARRALMARMAYELARAVGREPVRVQREYEQMVEERATRYFGGGHELTPEVGAPGAPMGVGPVSRDEPDDDDDDGEELSPPKASPGKASGGSGRHFTLSSASSPLSGMRRPSPLTLAADRDSLVLPATWSPHNVIIQEQLTHAHRRALDASAEAETLQREVSLLRAKMRGMQEELDAVRRLLTDKDEQLATLEGMQRSHTRFTETHAR